METQVSFSETSAQNSSQEKHITQEPDFLQRDEAYERRKQRQREYYHKNKDRIRAQQREYYATQDKAAHAARVRKYRQENKEKTAALRKIYRANNKEKFKAYDEKHQQKHRERLREKSSAYWEANREALLAQKREYNASANAKEKRRKYYEENKYRICNYILNCYCLKAIEQIRASCPSEVSIYMQRYPFEEYAEAFIRRALHRYNIYRSHGMYDDCYDAGMLAYLYSIHRCAVMQYTYTQAYIKKMIRVYIICAIVVYQESKNVCRVNGLREIHLDTEGFHNLH